MATRVYLGNAAKNPGLGSLSVGTNWNGTVGTPLLVGAFPTKQTTNAQVVGSGGATNPHNRYAATHCFGPLQAGTLSGTVKGQIRAAETGATDDSNPQVQIRVVSNDGGTVRGVALALDNSALSNEFAVTTLTNRKFPKGSSGAALSSTAITRGDFILIETGMRRFSTTGSNRTFEYRDDNATDLPEDETDTNAKNSWMEFSATLVLEQPPVIDSNGGGASANINVVENTTAVTTVHATDPNSDTITYSITGGSDSAKFAINSSSGALTFIVAPDFEAPTDSNTDNVYVVIVGADDGFNATVTQTLNVTVTDAAEGAPVAVLMAGMRRRRRM